MKELKHIDLIQMEVEELQEMLLLHPMLEPHRHLILGGNKEKLANIILAQQKSLKEAGKEAIKDIQADDE